MKSRIISSIVLGVLGGTVIGAGLWGKFYASADILAPYSQTLFQVAWISIIVGVLSIALSIFFFISAIKMPEKKERQFD